MFVGDKNSKQEEGESIFLFKNISLETEH